jgi:hypothetical protein
MKNFKLLKKFSRNFNNSLRFKWIFTILDISEWIRLNIKINKIFQKASMI